MELEQWKRKVEQLELQLQKLRQQNEGKDESEKMKAKAMMLEKTVEELNAKIESTNADTKKAIDRYKEKLEEEECKYIDLEKKMISSEIKLTAEERKNTVLNVEYESFKLKLKEEQVKSNAKDTELKNVHAAFQAKQTCDFFVMEVMEEAAERERDKQQNQITLMKQAMDVLQQELHKEQRLREKTALDIQGLRESISRMMAERERESAEKEAQQKNKLWHQVRVELLERRLLKTEQEKEKATFALTLAEEKASVANSCLVSTLKDGEEAAQGWLTLLRLQREHMDKRHATTTDTLVQQWRMDNQLYIRNVELEWSNKVAALTDKIRQFEERHQSTQEQVHIVCIMHTY